MTKFFLKCFIITTVLFLGVLIGIQIASNNIAQMTGDSRYSLSNMLQQEGKTNVAHTNQENDDKEQLTSHNLEEKQKKLEQIETFNLFSQMGSKLSEALNKIFSNLLSKITATIGSVLT